MLPSVMNQIPSTEDPGSATKKQTITVESSVIRFAGDSGDGMQIVGDQFTSTSAVSGLFFATLPDFPSEIRAPAGTVFGVSGFQVCVGGSEVFTPGDRFDVLLAMNPAALKVNLSNVKAKGVILVNEDAFVPKNLSKAGYAENPLDGDTLANYQVLRVPMAKMAQQALKGSSLSPREVERCKNFFALGLIYWLYDYNPENTRKWIERKFKSKPDIRDANLTVLGAGLEYAAAHESFTHSFNFKKSAVTLAPGVYRMVSGNQAAALGLIAGAQRAGLKLYLGSYPITPATDIMQELSKYRDFATVFQAEDEIAAIGSALGASFAGCLAATNTSGPGLSLKTEFMNLAVMVELPLVIIDVQRAGPSTGLPTKTEQSDLFQALWGRHGESPLAVLASSSPTDCFDTVFEACRLAIKYMTPVIVLSEGYLGNGTEVWRVPEMEELPKIPVSFRTDPENFLPYERNPETLARPWAIPGTPGLEHRLGGLEKEDRTGTVSHSPENHEKMVALRAQKIAKIAQDIPPMEVYGDKDAELLVLGWGGTEGAIKSAVRNLNRQGLKVASTHLRFINPFPADLKSLMQKYKKILVPENNTGQLWYRLRAEYLIDTERLNKVQGQPFRIDEIEAKIRSML